MFTLLLNITVFADEIDQDDFYDADISEITEPQEEIEEPQGETEELQEETDVVNDYDDSISDDIIQEDLIVDIEIEDNVNEPPMNMMTTSGVKLKGVGGGGIPEVGYVTVTVYVTYYGTNSYSTPTITTNAPSYLAFTYDYTTPYIDVSAMTASTTAIIYAYGNTYRFPITIYFSLA